MKTCLTVLLSLCLLAAPMAAGVSAGERTAPIPEPSASESPGSDLVFSAGSVPADSGITDAILLPVHALILAMWEHDLPYAPNSPIFVWTALYYTLSMYGETDERAQLTEDALVLPAESAEDFFHALFADPDAVPQLPTELSDFVRYDPLTEHFHLSLGDFSPTMLRLDPPNPVGNGIFEATGILIDGVDNSTLLSFHITLVENDTMFGFSVMDASIF